MFEVSKIKVLSTTTVDCPLFSTSFQIVHCHILPHLPKSLPLCCFSYFSYSVQTEVTFRTQMDGDKAGLSKSEQNILSPAGFTEYTPTVLTFSTECPGIPESNCNQRGVPGSTYQKIKCLDERDGRANSTRGPQNLSVLLFLYSSPPPASSGTQLQQNDLK